MLSPAYFKMIYIKVFRKSSFHIAKSFPHRLPGTACPGFSNQRKFCSSTAVKYTIFSVYLTHLFSFKSIIYYCENEQLQRLDLHHHPYLSRLYGDRNNL